MSSPSRTTTGRLQKLGLSLLVLLGAAATGTSAQKLCDLGGPDFPAPQKLSASPAFQQAKARLGAALGSNAALRPNDTAFSFALFSASEPGVLYEHHYTPPGANVGVPKVDGDSVYRIGSVSKVFAVWAFLAQLGDSHFNEPVTKFVPELKTAKPVYPGAAEDSIDSVRWEDVTLGDLASQTSGIGRDGMFFFLFPLVSIRSPAMGQGLRGCVNPKLTHMATQLDLANSIFPATPRRPASPPSTRRRCPSAAPAPPSLPRLARTRT